MDLKSFSGVEIKSESARQIEAVFRRHGIPDTDNEYTTAASFRDGQVCVISPWSHAVWESGVQGLPVGKGSIHNTLDGSATIFRGAFFPTDAGIAHFETLKHLGDSEFSFGFTCRRQPSELNGKSTTLLTDINCLEVSPCLRGAMGPGLTSLVSARSAPSPRITTSEDAMREAKELGYRWHDDQNIAQLAAKADRILRGEN
jgi:hypothetical protein